MYFVKGLNPNKKEALILDTSDKSEEWVSEDQLNEICKLGVDVEGIYPGKPNEFYHLYLSNVNYSVCISYLRNTALETKFNMMYNCSLVFDNLNRLYKIDVHQKIPESGRLVLDDFTYAFLGTECFLGTEIVNQSPVNFTLVFGEKIRYTSFTVYTRFANSQDKGGLHLIRYDLSMANENVCEDFARNMYWLYKNCSAGAKFYANCAKQMIVYPFSDYSENQDIFKNRGVDECFAKYHANYVLQLNDKLNEDHFMNHRFRDRIKAMSYSDFMRCVESPRWRSYREVLIDLFPRLMSYFDMGGRSEKIFSEFKRMMEGL